MTIAEKIMASGRATEKPSDQATIDRGSDKRKALGRGLDSLLPGRPRVVSPAAPAVISGSKEPALVDHEAVITEARAARTLSGDEVEQIALDKIDVNPYQTRQQFDETALAELAESIQVNGLLQPIVVRPAANGHYVLVLGERRCRASRMAGKTAIPAIVRKVSDQHAAEMTVVENLMRQDLNCLEQANAFSRLSREFGLTQEQIGQRTGSSRESVANYLRVLRLPQSVQQHIADGKLGFSEARVLLQLSDPKQIEQIANNAATSQFSVTVLQQLVNDTILANEGQYREPSPLRPIDANVRAAQDELQKILGVRVKISDKKGHGKIVIEYSNLDDFDRV
ncbi:MAG: ParB/RepB/Spo0J family partition protein, partial [Terriglobales bacterium]